MGTNTNTLDFLYESMEAAGIATLSGKRLLELGNQAIRRNARKSYNIDTGKSKVYFLELGCNHHSIDWNGLDGAIPLDLTLPIPIPKFMKYFDIVTDFGDMEHVRGFKDWMERSEENFKYGTSLLYGRAFMRVAPIIAANKDKEAQLELKKKVRK